MTYLTEEQAQQIEEALDTAYGLAESDWTEHKYAAALAIIRAARAQEQAEQEPVADYAYQTIEEYEDLCGMQVNEAFKIGWSMARTTNAMLGIKAAPVEPVKQEPVMITPGGGAFPFAVVCEIEQAEQEPVAFKFVRYVDGKEMAEGVTIEREKTLDAAIKKAVALCPNRNKTVLVYAAPVRTKDLTREEIGKVSAAYGQHSIKGFDHILSFARAVIAADREKNK